MSGILSAVGISQARANNGLVGANDVSVAIKVSPNVWPATIGGINSTRHSQSQATKKKGEFHT